MCNDVPAAQDTQAPGGAYTCGPCNSGFEKENGTNSECIGKPYLLLSLNIYKSSNLLTFST